MTAEQAIKRSISHNEIVTLDVYSESDFETLCAECAECDSNVLANGVWEFWADDWRVHMPETA